MADGRAKLYNGVVVGAWSCKMDGAASLWAGAMEVLGLGPEEDEEDLETLMAAEAAAAPGAVTFRSRSALEAANGDMSALGGEKHSDGTAEKSFTRRMVWNPWSADIELRPDLSDEDEFFVRSAIWRAELLDRRDALRDSETDWIPREVYHLGELCRLCTQVLQLHAESTAGRVVRGIPEQDFETNVTRLRELLDSVGLAQLARLSGEPEIPLTGNVGNLSRRGFCVLSGVAEPSMLEALHILFVRQKMVLNTLFY